MKKRQLITRDIERVIVLGGTPPNSHIINVRKKKHNTHLCESKSIQFNMCFKQHTKKNY